MFDKELLKLIGGNKKYVVYTVLLMVLGMLANIGITASICWAVYFLIEGYEPLAYIYPAITAVIAIIVRYIASRCTGNLKDMLGRKVKKDLRERTYDKILKLGVRSTDGMSMAGLTQVSMEGIEPWVLIGELRLCCLLACRLFPSPSWRFQSTQKRYSQSIGASTPRWVTPF